MFAHTALRIRSAAGLLATAFFLLLAGCDRHPQAGGDQTVDANSPLELAARERGIVRPDTASPTGVFERSHELGRDAMCVVPDGAGQWRFALSASFGPGLRCAARGTPGARRTPPSKLL